MKRALPTFKRFRKRSRVHKIYPQRGDRIQIISEIKGLTLETGTMTLRSLNAHPDLTHRAIFTEFP